MKIVEVCSDIPGALSLWHVEDGSKVEEDEPICEVECMKTLMRVLAPATGTVRYRMSLGEVVGQENVIAVIEVEE